MVIRAVFMPMRAAAIAASHPAWPAPTTTTSYFSEKVIEPRKSADMFILRIPQFMCLRAGPGSAIIGRLPKESEGQGLPGHEYLFLWNFG